MVITANVRRDGRWWSVSIPEVEGLVTQARTLADVREQAAEAVATLLDVRLDSIEVGNVVVEIDPEAREAFIRAEELREEAAQADAEAASEMRRGVGVLVAAGMTLRDIGSLLDIPYQEATELVADVKHEQIVSDIERG